MKFFGHIMADSNIVGISPVLRVEKAEWPTKDGVQFSFEVYCRAYAIRIFTPVYISAAGPADQPDKEFMEEYNNIYKRVQNLLS